MNLEDIIKLWYETQHGHYIKCRNAQIEFSEIMNELYEKLDIEEPTQQCHGDEPI